MKTNTSLIYQNYLQMDKDNSVSLYVHIPFCTSKCDYCDFTSFPITTGTKTLFSDYFEALKSELLFWKNHHLNSNNVLTSLYIGGGTPSVVPVEYYQSFFNEVFRIFSSPLEFTCEVNPSSVSQDFLLGLKDFGCTRISMGMQSPSDKTLKKVHRTQTLSKFLKQYSTIRSLFSNVNVDLICGLPEDLQEWSKQSGYLLENLSPEHCSVYVLEVEKDTPLGKNYRNGMIELPSFEYTTEIFEQLIWRLIGLGYRQYEISNFSYPGYESIHNHAYWQSKNYIGLGVSAGGLYHNLRYVNTHSLKAYMNSQFDQEKHYDHRVVNSPEAFLKEFLFMGLRLKKGIAVKDLEARFPDSSIGKIVKILASSRFMNLSDGYLKLVDYYFIHNREAFEYLLEVI